jgi:predicted alpha/beta superfamily hydrolase
MWAMSEGRGVASSEMALNAHRVDFTSATNGRAYRLFISVPSGETPIGGWPVIYLIDGNLHFGIAVDTVRIQSRWPETLAAVVVGVGYQTDSVLEALSVRTHDLTPETSEAWTKRDWQASLRASAGDFGGMDAYIRMLLEEAPAKVAPIARINPNDAALMGHSLGGLTTLAVLFRHPQAFRSYVAISPSIWMSDDWVLGLVDPFEKMAQGGAVSARLLMTAGEFEERVPVFPPLPKSGAPMSQATYDRMTEACRMVSNVKALAKRLAPLKDQGLSVDVFVHPSEDHRSVVPAGIARGVYFSLYRHDADASL